MKIASKAVTETFKLKSDSDSEAPATVTIKQASWGADKIRSELFAKRTQVFKDVDFGEYKVESSWNPYEVQAREIWLTMCGATGFVDDTTGEELFRFRSTKDGTSAWDMSEHQFQQALSRLGTEVVEEIHKFVLKVNPQWDSTRTGE